jgi:hypothetical protein
MAGNAREERPVLEAALSLWELFDVEVCSIFGVSFLRADLNERGYSPPNVCALLRDRTTHRQNHKYQRKLITAKTEKTFCLVVEVRKPVPNQPLNDSKNDRC